jgi:hypothetical protein
MLVANVPARMTSPWGFVARESTVGIVMGGVHCFFVQAMSDIGGLASPQR